MTPDEIRQRVLNAVADGRLPRGGPSHLAALDLINEISGSTWEEWGRAAAERIRAKATRPPCICGTFSEPEPSGRCGRCWGWLA
jgi:hypothetical protein